MEQTQAIQTVQQQAPAQLVTMQLTEQQAAWAGLPLQKNALTESLQRQELTAQGLLQQAEAAGDKWADIDTNLAAYRKLHTEMIEGRKPFTGMIQDRIIAPLMAFEKRVDPKSNEKYNELFNKSVDLRRKENLAASVANAKNQEKANFTSHFTNEHVRIVGLYKATVMREATNIYSSYLKGGIQDPALQELKQKLAEVPQPAMTAFIPQYLKPEEMQELYKTIAPINWNETFAGLMMEVDNLFANYASDLANAEAAIKAQEDALQLATQAADKKIQEEQAINTLVINAAAPTIEGPKIKKNLKVTVRTDWAWMKAVMAAFMVNFDDLSKWISVKEPGNLKVAQMADYLGKLATETGLTFNGLELEEVCK